MMHATNFDFQGLNKDEVLASRTKYGNNTFNYKKENTFWDAFKSVAKEPMVILLLVASTIYFATGNWGDGMFLVIAIILVASISLYQDSRSRKALENLKNLTQPNCNVIREGKTSAIRSSQLVIGDYVMIEEGSTIPADGIIVHSNDFSVDESILTGESLSVS